MEERIIEGIVGENQRNMEVVKRRLEIQVEERGQELQAKYSREFEAAVSARAEEMAKKREKEAH